MEFSDYGIDLNGRTGQIKTTCPQCSHQRKKKDLPCLNVNTDKGVWNCWHCGFKGGIGKGIERHGSSKKLYTTRLMMLNHLQKVSLVGSIRERYQEKY